MRTLPGYLRPGAPAPGPRKMSSQRPDANGRWLQRVHYEDSRGGPVCPLRARTWRGSRHLTKDVRAVTCHDCVRIVVAWGLR